MNRNRRMMAVIRFRSGHVALISFTSTWSSSLAEHTYNTYVSCLSSAHWRNPISAWINILSVRELEAQAEDVESSGAASSLVENTSVWIQNLGVLFPDCISCHRWHSPIVKPNRWKPYHSSFRMSTLMFIRYKHSIGAWMGVNSTISFIYQYMRKTE